MTHYCKLNLKKHLKLAHSSICSSIIDPYNTDCEHFLAEYLLLLLIVYAHFASNTVLCVVWCFHSGLLLLLLKQCFFKNVSTSVVIVS